MTVSTYLSIITLSEIALNFPMKRQSVAEWIKKKKALYVLPIRDLLQK